MNSPFRLTEFDRALSRSRGRSIGPDGVSYRMMKNLDISIRQTFLNILNQIWTQRLFPNIWRHAFTIPIPKPNRDPTKLDSFRPITSTCNPVKTVERMGMFRMNIFLESNHIYNPHQNGFRRNRSCIDNLVVLKQVISEGLKTNSHAYCVFFDMQKAYDGIYRPLAMRQIIKAGIGGNMAHFLRNFLTRRKFQVNLDGFSSSIKDLENGVPQGSVASVYLFFMAINEFEKALETEFKEKFPNSRLILLPFANDKATVIICKH